jgi:hypothetical protein
VQRLREKQYRFVRSRRKEVGVEEVDSNETLAYQLMAPQLNPKRSDDVVANTQQKSLTSLDDPVRVKRTSKPEKRTAPVGYLR